MPQPCAYNDTQQAVNKEGVKFLIRNLLVFIQFGDDPIGQNQPCDKQDGVVTDGDAEDGESFYLGIPPFTKYIQ